MTRSKTRDTQRSISLSREGFDRLTRSLPRNDGARRLRLRHVKHTFDHAINAALDAEQTTN